MVAMAVKADLQVAWKVLINIFHSNTTYVALATIRSLMNTLIAYTT